MRKVGVCGLLAAIGLMAASEGAYSQNIVPVNCLTDPQGAAALQAQFANGGTANTTYQITGPCNGTFTITQGNISITTAVAGVAQTINGSIVINGATNATLDDLTINGQVVAENSGEVNIGPNTTTFTIQGVTDDGVLTAKGATVNISSTTIQNNTGDGLHAIAGAVIVSNGNTISSNGGVGILVERGVHG